MLHGISCLIYQVGCCLAQDHPYHIVNIFGTAVEPLREREREREGGREREGEGDWNILSSLTVFLTFSPAHSYKSPSTVWMIQSLKYS